MALFRVTLEHNSDEYRESAAFLVRRRFEKRGAILTTRTDENGTSYLFFDLPSTFPMDDIPSIGAGIDATYGTAFATTLPPITYRTVYPDIKMEHVDVSLDEPPQFTGEENFRDICSSLNSYLSGNGIQLGDDPRVLFSMRDRYVPERAARRLAELAYIGPEEDGAQRIDIIDGVEATDPRFGTYMKNTQNSVDSDLKDMMKERVGIVEKVRTGVYRITDSFVPGRHPM